MLLTNIIVLNRKTNTVYMREMVYGDLRAPLRKAWTLTDSRSTSRDWMIEAVATYAAFAGGREHGPSRSAPDLTRYDERVIRAMSDDERAALPQYVLCHWRKYDGSIDTTRLQILNLRDLKWGYMPPMDIVKAEKLCNELNGFM